MNNNNKRNATTDDDNDLLLENNSNSNSNKKQKLLSSSEMTTTTMINEPINENDLDEAAKFARIAARAEERALERAQQKQKQQQQQQVNKGKGKEGTSIIEEKKIRYNDNNNNNNNNNKYNNKMISSSLASAMIVGNKGKLGSTTGGTTNKIKFMSKREREAAALARLEAKRNNNNNNNNNKASNGAMLPPSSSSSGKSMMKDNNSSSSSSSISFREKDNSKYNNNNNNRDNNNSKYNNNHNHNQRILKDVKQERMEREKERMEAKQQRDREKEMAILREERLGFGKRNQMKKKIIRPSEKFSKQFTPDWDLSEDTSSDLNPLYNRKLELNPLFGRGYVAGLDMREQRKRNHFVDILNEKRAQQTDLTDQQRNAMKEHVDHLHREEERKTRDEQRKRRREDRHWSEKPLVDMTERDWRIFKEDFDISVRGGRAPKPLRYWEEAHLPDVIMKAIKDLGYEKPSPIQRQGIPIGLHGKDIVGIAETGSGKTCAFVIPMIAYIMKLPQFHVDRVSEEGPLALVMAPVRELAQQIESECKKLLKYTNYKTVCAVGGQDIMMQAQALKRGVEIIIGTPGRLNDCLENRYLVLNQCNYVVLDEADQMINMGFEQQVLDVMDGMGTLLKDEDEEKAEQQAGEFKDGIGSNLYRTTCMFSATMPTEVERLAQKYLRHPSTVKIGDQDSGKNKRIEQEIIWTVPAAKPKKMKEVLNRLDARKDKCIVFVNAKKDCDRVAKMLEDMNIRCCQIHSNKSQDQREASLAAFKAGDYRVVIATDVMGRGIDISDVTHVINYDLPVHITKYTHRIGRTGRAGRTGTAISLLTEENADIMFDLKKYLESTNMPVPHELASHPASKHAPGSRNESGNFYNARKKDTVIYT